LFVDEGGTIVLLQDAFVLVSSGRVTRTEEEGVFDRVEGRGSKSGAGGVSAVRVDIGLGRLAEAQLHRAHARAAHQQASTSTSLRCGAGEEGLGEPVGGLALGQRSRGGVADGAVSGVLLGPVVDCSPPRDVSDD
jgi:hypothetical protein